jgi:tRNA dimethylallyltransferase
MASPRRTTKDSLKRKALVVCGPTAAGKSALADELVENVSMASGDSCWVTTIVVDSMQVYREIPVITNQARTRPAEMLSIVSVIEEWTVARHKERAEALIDSLPPNLPFMLDAGTGMYLNALVLDIPLAPKVSPAVRAEAEKRARGAENPKREARKLELELTGYSERGSIWSGNLRYDASFIYLRPKREDLDRSVRARSSKIVNQGGAEEAKRLLKSGIVLNPSVRQAIGVKELLLCASGELSCKEAEEIIAVRTRRLARRQIRWFDKLVRNLPFDTPITVVESTRKAQTSIQCMVQ